MIDDTLFDNQVTDSTADYRLAVVVSASASGASVQFESESSASDQIYSVIQNYSPTVGDRVVMLRISGTYIILGSVGAPKVATGYIPSTEKGVANGVATLNEAGKVTQTALLAVNAMNAANATNATHATSATSASTAVSFAGAYSTINTLGSSETLSDVITKVNSIISVLSHFNAIY